MTSETTYQDNFIRGVHYLISRRPELQNVRQAAVFLDIGYMALYKVMDRTNKPTTELCIRLCQKAGYNANWMFLNQGPMYLKEYDAFRELQLEVQELRKKMTSEFSKLKKELTK